MYPAQDLLAELLFKDFKNFLVSYFGRIFY
jgi:hypothetical protein